MITENEPLSRLRKNDNLSYFESIAPSRHSYRRRHHYYWDEITKYCDYFSHHDISVLEVGCGTGELISQIKGKRKLGLDFSPKMIEEAKKNSTGDTEFRVMDAEELELDEKFDLIICAQYSQMLRTRSSI